MSFVSEKTNKIVMDNAKNNILQRLRNIRNHSTSLPYPSINGSDGIFPAPDEDLDILFAEHFRANGGQFVFCESQKELINDLNFLMQQNQWTKILCWEDTLQKVFDYWKRSSCNNFDYEAGHDNLLDAEVSITTCEALIARTGAVLLSSESQSGRTLSIVPPVHIVIATTNQLVYNIKDVLSLQTAREEMLPSMLCFTSTNSRTADIEKTLVNGAHGPKQLFVFMLETA